MSVEEFYDYCLQNLPTAKYIDAGVYLDTKHRRTYKLIYEPKNSSLVYIHGGHHPENVIKITLDEMKENAPLKSKLTKK